MTPGATEAARELALRALDYVGWLNGTHNTLLDGDVALRKAALAVFEALGEDPPMRVVRKKRGRPAPSTSAPSERASGQTPGGDKKDPS